jgi:site-specific DNA-methyltransferase (adenine-specific)
MQGATSWPPTGVKPYYSDESTCIILGDCRDVLPTLGPVDLVLTSPPWNCRLRYAEYTDDMPDAEFRQLNADWLRLTFELATEGTRLYAVVSDQMLWWLRPLAEHAGWRWGQLMAWCKPNFAGKAGRISGDWNNMTEWMMLFRKGKKTPMQNGTGSTHNYMVIPSPQRSWNEDRRKHVAQWPVRLPLRLLSRTPGEVVLDPFCGSGSALVAAKQLGRRAIGIDVDESACEIAAQRMAQAVLPL